MRVPLWLKLGAVLVASTGFAGADRPDLPRWKNAPWEFLDGTGEISQATSSKFRAAIEGDFDRDGDLDVLVAQAISSAGVDGTPTPGQVFMNEGGRFVDRTQAVPGLSQLTTPQVRWWATVADFGGPAGPPDGWPDVFVAGGQSEPSRMFINQGAPSGVWQGFQQDQSRLANTPITTSTHSYNSRAADFNGDGQMDLVVFQYKPNLGTCTVPYAATCFGQTRMLINSNGILVDETATRLPNRNEPSIFGQAKDLNGDGAPDITLVNLKNGLVPGIPAGVPSVRLMLNDGSGHFQGQDQIMPERINPGSSLGTYSLEAGDFNGDGRTDLFIINWGMSGDEARDGVLLNLGSGNQLFPGGANGIAYPEGTAPLDDDGDQPVAADLNGDGRLDVVVAQFATRPYVLINQSRGSAMKLVANVPAQVPDMEGFRNKLFDANGDGVIDMWLALRDKNYLVLGGLPEREPNDSMATANVTGTFPSLRTAILHIDDQDVFSLPAAVSAGARIRLRPAANGDLRLSILDAGGTVLFTSGAAGNGAVETIDLAAASGAAFARVERQGAQTGGAYRLEIVRPGGALTEAAVGDPGRAPRMRTLRGRLGDASRGDLR